jgi:hypothetical protein
MLVRKLFPLPKISTTLLQLTGFTYYATTLDLNDLNMGNYTIRIDAILFFHGVSTLTGDHLWELVGTGHLPRMYVRPNGRLDVREDVS